MVKASLWLKFFFSVYKSTECELCVTANTVSMNQEFNAISVQSQGIVHTTLYESYVCVSDYTDNK